MKQQPRRVFSVGLFVVVITGLWWFSATSAFAQRTINCASKGERYEYCRADTNGYVRLEEQFSDAPCIAGRTWGYDDMGIWVKDGCRARFAIGRQNYYNPSQRRGKRDYDERDYYDQSAPAARMLRCESKGERYNYCPAETRGYARLERQLSDARCEKWYSWGYDWSGIWVDHGCRAEFSIGRRRGYSRDWPWQ
ncbi:MAG: DUF3011 domain-containing protein [Candidatus Binatia bacterium]